MTKRQCYCGTCWYCEHYPRREQLIAKRKSPTLAEHFLDYFNNYLSIERFAEHQEMSVAAAKSMIEAGRIEHENNVEKLKNENN